MMNHGENIPAGKESNLTGWNCILQFDENGLLSGFNKDWRQFASIYGDDDLKHMGKGAHYEDFIAFCGFNRSDSKRITSCVSNILMGSEDSARLKIKSTEVGEGWFRITLSKLEDVPGFTLVLGNISFHEGLTVSQSLSEEHIHFFLEHSPDIVINVNEEGKVTYVNRPIFGKTRERIIGFDLETLFHDPSLKEKYTNATQTVFAKGTSAFFAYPEEDRYFLTRMEPIPIKGRINSAMILITDITERKKSELAQERAEQLLKESENRFALFMKYLPGGVSICDSEGHLLFANDWLMHILSRQREELIGKPIQETLEDYGKRIHQLNQRVLSEGRATVYETTGPANNHQHFLETCFPIPMANNTFVVGSISQDISDRKVTEDQLKSMAREAQGANLAKSEFLARMSHEIRTPMNAILGMTRLLMESPLDDEQMDFAETVYSSADALLGIINEILDFSKIEAGHIELEEIDFSLEICLKELVDMFTAQIREKGLKLTYKVDHDVPDQLSGDPGRLRQILVNLLANAIKFTDKGHIQVTVSLERKVDTPELLFQVIDTGIGIESHQVNRLFEPFTQADGSITRRYGGTGLGLSICKEITELMGGSIGVYSEIGKGSKFWFIVPIKEQKQPKTIEGAPDGYFGNLRIMIADDQMLSQQTIKVLLNGWNCQVSTKLKKDHALVQMRTAHSSGNPYNVLIVNLNMGKDEGLQLVNEVRRDPTLNKIALIIMSQVPGTLKPPPRSDEYITWISKPPKPVSLQRALLAIGGHGMDPMKEIFHLEQGNFKTSPRILLVEDNSINRKVALKILDRLGYVADAVADGREALLSLSTIPYDLVLMDVEMPVMNGLEATRLIRSDPANAAINDIPIIAMTAQAHENDRIHCMEAGMNDYIVKPVDPGELNRTIKRWCIQKALKRKQMLPKQL